MDEINTKLSANLNMPVQSNQPSLLQPQREHSSILSSPNIKKKIIYAIIALSFLLILSGIAVYILNPWQTENQVYRIYESKNKITLVDQDGKVVKSSSIKYPLNLKAQVGDHWLLFEDSSEKYIAQALDSYEAVNHFLLSNKGIITPVQDKVNKELQNAEVGTSSIPNILTVSDEEILYVPVFDSRFPDEHVITRLNLFTGEKRTINTLPEDMYFTLEQTSPDFRTAYLLTVTMQEEQKDILWELIKLDTQNGNFEKIPLKGIKSIYMKLWVSPNGKYLVYSKNSENAVEIYNVDTHQIKSLPLPMNSVTESLGGETLATPVWSPDSTKFLFSSFLRVDNKPYQHDVYYIDINDFSVNALFSTNSKEDDVDHLGWHTNTIAQFAVYQSDTASIFRATHLNNFEYNTETKKLKSLPIEYGFLMGKYYY